MATQLQNSEEKETTLTLSGHHVGPEIPVRIRFEVGDRPDEYGDLVRDTRLDTVEVDEDTSAVEVDGDTRALWAGDELPVELFEVYESEIDKAMYEAE